MNECIVCHNETQKQLITYIQEYYGKWVAIDRVPADVCPICGEQYFDPDTVDKIQNTINSHSPKKSLNIPVYELLAAT